MTAFSPSQLIAEITDRARQQMEEHERRMATDPEYRAEQEQVEAQRREDEEKADRAEELVRREELERHRKAKGIPEKFWPYLDAWRAGAVADLPASVAKAHAAVQRFLAGAPGWVFLFLLGPVGVGKTVAALWFLDAPRVRLEPDPWGGKARRVTRDVGGRFVTAEQLAKASTFAADSLWNEAREAPRLVIDDLGVERLDDKGWALANLTALLCHRHAYQLPTLITANLTRKAIEERYAAHDGGRLRDRLGESAWPVELTGPSLRSRLSLDLDVGPRNP